MYVWCDLAFAYLFESLADWLSFVVFTERCVLIYFFLLIIMLRVYFSSKHQLA